ncbi:glycosyltransferase family 4 protein [Geminocystis sp. NIES-3709]|uniref:glycosyltransferase family 4 protein n=1 Tax=Geminocystis sp. NIES-3709 TaxID=1617448 RepID=UPI0005FCBD77|nr:glycosyltransferase family 4 protein [Geminocystis sp. NIES-3709]BAQ66450.1 glycosyltransferase [Geminocystis sp. NIES-3709]
MLAIIETHPIQYRSPVYQTLSTDIGIPMTVIYGSDFSISGYKDKEFGTQFAWDIDLLSGYSSQFLSNVKTGGAKSFDDVSSRGLAKLLREIKPKAVLITGYNHALYKSAFYHSWKLNIPILFRAETTDFAMKRNSIKSWLRGRTLSFLYSNCSKLLYIGNNSRRHFQRLGVEDEKLIFSPYCVDTRSFKLSKIDRQLLRSNTRHNLGIQENQKVLLFSGKLSYRKGVDLILPAIQKLPQEIQKQLVILFLGDGELRGELEKQARSSSYTKTHFLGFQNQTQLSKYYHCSDILILPSRYSETWGLVVNEALHHGLPCVVSRAVGCASDLIKSDITGYTFETDCLDSLTQMIKNSLDLCDRVDTLEKCQEQVSHYSVAKAAEGIAISYDFILK